MKKQDLVTEKAEEQMNQILDSMSGIGDVLGESYDKLLTRVERLDKLRKKEEPRKKLSPDTALVVAGNLLGIIAILGYEQGHVIATKALGFVIKGRV